MLHTGLIRQKYFQKIMLILTLHKFKEYKENELTLNSGQMLLFMAQCALCPLGKKIASVSLLLTSYFLYNSLD